MLIRQSRHAMLIAASHLLCIYRESARPRREKERPRREPARPRREPVRAAGENLTKNIRLALMEKLLHFELGYFRMVKVPSLAGQSSPRTPPHLAIFGSGRLYALCTSHSATQRAMRG